MKTLWRVSVLTLALNFLGVLAGVVWLHQTGRIDRDKLLAIKEIVFPPLPQADEAPLETELSPATQPATRLEQLLAQHSGLPPGDQMMFMQRSFDAQMALLDRRQTELESLQRQVEIAREQLERDRADLTTDQTALAARVEEAERLKSDEGFQDTLELYQSMPSKQVKAIFMTLDDSTVVRYLRSMEPRAAARIIKEFKSPDEVARIQKVLEDMRQAQASIEGP